MDFIFYEKCLFGVDMGMRRQAIRQYQYFMYYKLIMLILKSAFNIWNQTLLFQLTTYLNNLISKVDNQYKLQMNNYRPTTYGNSYLDQNNRLGYSAVSKGFGYSNRNYANQDQNFGQVQFMLQNQRKKFKEAKQKYEYDLDNERKMRIQFENKLIKLKDEFSRKQVTISELQFKINNLLHQNQDVIVENERLKGELGRLQQLYGGKIHQLQTTLSMESRNFQETTIQYNTQFQKFKKEGQEYVEQLTFQFERKIKNLQEKFKAAQNTKRDLLLQNKKLNDILISNKLAFEEQIRDLKNRSRDQQMKKAQQMSKSFEQKLKMVEESRQLVNRKNTQLLRAIQDKERQINDIQGEKAEQVNRLRQDNSDMSQQINHLNYLITKLKSEIADKDNQISGSIKNNDGELQSLRQQLQIKKQQNYQLSMNVKQVRMALKDSESQWERKKRQLVQRANMMEGQARKYKQEYVRICDVLKSKINDTINNTVPRR